MRRGGGGWVRGGGGKEETEDETEKDEEDIDLCYKTFQSTLMFQYRHTQEGLIQVSATYGEFLKL